MTKVTLWGGVEYGLSIFSYVIALGIVSVLTIFVGAAMVDSSPLLGALLILVGVVAGMAGMAGLQYKIIADAVAAGMEQYEESG